MDDFQELFGDSSLSYEEFTQKVTASGKKYADISGGGYVAKGKFDKLNADFAKYKEDNDISKYADYDTLKAELDTLKAEKAESQLLADVTAAKVDSRFAKFVLSEVKALVTESKDFKTCLTEYLTANPQYVQVEEKKEEPVFRMGSQVNIDKGNGGKADMSKMSMSDYIKARKNK